MRPFLCTERANDEPCAGSYSVRAMISRGDAEARRGKKGTHEKVDCNVAGSDNGH